MKIGNLKSSLIPRYFLVRPGFDLICKHPLKGSLVAVQSKKIPAKPLKIAEQALRSGTKLLRERYVASRVGFSTSQNLRK